MAYRNLIDKEGAYRIYPKKKKEEPISTVDDYQKKFLKSPEAYDTRQKKPVRWKCQFTWYCDGKKDEPNFESRTWRLALDHASILITKRIVLDITEGATHYHATYVRPAWAKTKTRTTRIDRHIFYRWEK